MYRINEVFYSIQSEGRFTGFPAVFIRFSGCNLNCDFCDTEHQSYKEYSLQDIFYQIRDYPTKRIILTGGEPTLQVDKELIKFLKKNGYIIHIETNGTNEIDYQIDWLTVSPKKNWKLKKGNELKVIYQGQDLNQYLDSDFDYYYLQPLSMQNIHKTLTAVLENPQWNLSLQIHKILKIK